MTATAESATVAKPMPLWVVAILALGSAVALGWARFAYGLLLPSMQEAMQWSYTVAGSLTTASTLGYLSGAIGANAIARRLGLQCSVLVGMALTTVCLLACAVATSLPTWLVLQFGGGLGGSMIFIVGSIVVANGATTRRRAAVGLALYVSGAGFGVAVAAFAIPLLLALPIESAWRWGWVILALFSGLSFLAVFTIRGYFVDSSGQTNSKLPLRNFVQLVPMTAAYSLYGLGYIGYLTFLSALLQQEKLSHIQVSMVWIVLGLASVVTSFFWGRVFARLHNGQGMAVVQAAITVGVMLPVFADGLPIALVSALLFGGAMLAAPPAVTHFIRDSLPTRYWVSAMASITACFGVGQVVGPELVGYLADVGGGVYIGFAAAATSLGLASAVALCQRPLREDGSSPEVTDSYARQQAH